jgi:hypothetical protein
MDELGQEPATRENYAIGYEEGVRQLILAALGENPDIKGIASNGSLIVNMIFSYPFIQSMLVELQQEDYDGFANDFEMLLYQLFDVNGDSVAPVRAIYDRIYWLVVLLAVNVTARADLTLQLFSRDNILNLFTPHNADMNYSFLRSCDSRLYGGEAVSLNDGTYRVLHVKDPSYVRLYEETLGRDVFTYRDGTMGSDVLCCEKLADGSLNVFLPNNGAFRYVIHAGSSSLGKIDEYGLETPWVESLGSEGRL